MLYGLIKQIDCLYLDAVCAADGVMAMEHRIILRLDMNAFFASVEQQANPALRGKPIAVIGSNGRTVITTASYEARKFGVKTGMAIWEAKRQCPQIILVVGDNRKYTYIYINPDFQYDAGLHPSGGGVQH